MMHLPIDGLPALLQALSDGGVDVTVISGPPLLEEADARARAPTAKAKTGKSSPQAGPTRLLVGPSSAMCTWSS
jgi:hypothetical protein